METFTHFDKLERRAEHVGARRPASRLHHVDVSQAHRVAQVFLEAPSLPRDRMVRTAYEMLATQADQLFDRVAGGSARAPIRVVHTGCPEPYATAGELAERVRSTRVLELWPTHFDRERAHPLLDSSIGGSLDRVRAVHDIVSHAGLGHGFDRDGEYSAWLAESRLYSGMARWALATELHAQHSALWATGSLAERKAVLLPLDLLAASYDDAPARADAGLVAGVHTTSTRPRSESAARVDVPRT